MNKEKFWESRRVWGAGLTLVATALIIAFPENVIIIAPIMTGLAGLLGLGSWTFPKKETQQRLYIFFLIIKN